MKSQEIKLKSADLKKAVVRGLNRRLWEKKTGGRSTKELVHASLKLKKGKYKKRFTNLEGEF